MNHQHSQSPLIFLKPTTAVIAPEDNIIVSANVAAVDYEGELGIVIGKKPAVCPRRKRWNTFLVIPVLRCYAAICSSATGQWTRAKGFDNLAPFALDQDGAGPVHVPSKLSQRAIKTKGTTPTRFLSPETISFISPR